jgi:hypothetical protein
MSGTFTLVLIFILVFVTHVHTTYAYTHIPCMQTPDRSARLLVEEGRLLERKSRRRLRSHPSMTLSRLGCSRHRRRSSCPPAGAEISGSGSRSQPAGRRGDRRRGASAAPRAAGSALCSAASTSSSHACLIHACVLEPTAASSATPHSSALKPIACNAAMACARNTLQYHARNTRDAAATMHLPR